MALSRLLPFACIIFPIWPSLITCSTAPFHQDLKELIDNFNTSCEQHTSSGGGALCTSCSISVNVTAPTRKLLLDEPKGQYAVTQFFQDAFSVASATAPSLIGPEVTTKATYDIDGTLCFPQSQAHVDSVLVLTHGAGLDKTYWDIASNYSFIESAAEVGYATFAYNRLGVGQSSKPDPIQAVQSYTDVEVLHSIATQFRSGSGSARARGFKKVIGVGHSYGSIIQLANNAKYPDDLDASVQTGIANVLTYLAETNNPTVAAIASPDKYANLPYAYCHHNSAISIAQSFMKYPYFSETILNRAANMKALFTLGQAITLPSVFAPAKNYSKPVDIVLGEADFSFCGGDCNFNGTDAAAATLASFWPARLSGSQSFLVKDSGHLINFHFTAQQAYSHIFQFLKDNKL